MTMSMPAPVRTGNVPLLKGVLKTQPGQLLLYPDRLVHVVSKPSIGMAFGVIGIVLARRAAAKGARVRAVAGGDGVLSLPLGHVRSVCRGKFGFNKKVLEVTMSDGSMFPFGAKYDDWAPELARLATQLGRNVNPVVDGYDLA